jgi:hypothetical protein
MWCVKCNHDLYECTCPDLKERLETINSHPNILIMPEALDEYRKQAERNKWPDTVEDSE